MVTVARVCSIVEDDVGGGWTELDLAVCILAIAALPRDSAAPMHASNMSDEDRKYFVLFVLQSTCLQQGSYI